MPLTITDAVLILTLFAFAFTGFWFGFIHMLGSFASIVIAAIISGRYFDFVAQKLSFLFGGYENLGRIVTFIIIFLVVTRLVGFVFWIINKFFNLLALLPFMKTINRLGGAIFGFVEGLVLTSLSLYLLVRYPLNDSMTQAISNSSVVDYLLDIANRVAPLLPDVVQKARSVVGM
jgi:membrane protein required for colicin V production